MARPFEFDRNIVLDKAMLLFWGKGYFNTSAQDVVDHLALSRSSIYNSFTDKRALFIEALRYYINKESASMTDTLAQLTPDRENLEKILEQVVSRNFSASNPKGCFVVNTAIEFAGHDKEIRQIVEDNVKQTVSAFEKFIRSGQEKGYFGNAINPNDLAVALFHQITALRVTGKVVTGKSFFNKTIRAFMQLFN